MGRRTRIDAVTIRRGGPEDFEPALTVWRSANAARLGGRETPPYQEARARGHVGAPDAFPLVAEAGGEVVGMALGEQARGDDGAGPPIPGLCHVSMVFVAPDRWGEGIGGRLVAALLAEARSLGYVRVQLWTQSDNTVARRLYEGHSFRRTGREKDEFGERILHYARTL